MVKSAAEPKPGNRTTLPAWSLPLIVCVLAIRVGSLIFDRGFSSYDDGVAAEGARLILHGKVPYRDFWTIYAPASFYANALGLAVLGERLISIRILGLLQAGVQALLLCAILRRIGCRSGAIAVSGVVFLALIPLGTMAFWFTTTLLAAYALMRLIERPQSGWGYACGFSIGLTLLFRQDIGVYLSVAALPLVYAATRDRGARRLTPLLRVVGVIVVMAAAAAAYFAARGALPAMLDQAVRFASLEYPGSRPLPYPAPWHEVLVIGQYSAPISIAFLFHLYGFYLMPAVLLVLGILSIRRLRQDGYDRGQMQVAALLWLALVVFLMVRVRPSGARIVASATLSVIAYAVLAADKNKVVRVGAIAGLCASLAAFIPFGAYTIWAQQAYAPSVIGEKGGVYAAAGHAECLTVVSAKIRELTSPSERILAGAPVIYFLSDRDPATRYYEPHPRMTNTPKTQRAIIQDIERNHTRYFVRSGEWGRENYFTIEPQWQPRALIDYIARNYAVKYDYTFLKIYERKTPFPGLPRT